jgi:hypothetical protein
MTEPAQTFVKWTVALLVLAGVVLYALENLGPAISQGVALRGDEDSEDDGDIAAGGPVTDGAVAPVVDVSVAGGTATGLTAPTLAIGPGPGDAALLAFDLVQGSPDCLATLNLEMSVLSATGPTELGAYPSGVFEATALADAGPVQGELVLDRTAPPVQLTDGTPGRLRWDVLDVYRTWASGQPFASGATVPEGTRFTVAVRATDEGAIGREVVFDASESPSGPTLVFTGVPGCGA